MKAPTAPMIASVRMIFPAVFTTVLSLGCAARVPPVRRRFDGLLHPSGGGYAAFRFAQTVLAGIEGVGGVCSLSRIAFDTICGTRSVGTPRIRLLHLTDRELDFILKRRCVWFHRSDLRLTYECVRLRRFLPVSTWPPLLSAEEFLAGAVVGEGEDDAGAGALLAGEAHMQAHGGAQARHQVKAHARG